MPAQIRSNDAKMRRQRLRLKVKKAGVRRPTVNAQQNRLVWRGMRPDMRAGCLGREFVKAAILNGNHRAVRHGHGVPAYGRRRILASAHASRRTKSPHAKCEPMMRAARPLKGTPRCVHTLPLPAMRRLLQRRCFWLAFCFSSPRRPRRRP